MTAALRVHLKQQINLYVREQLADERVVFCSYCFEPNDKGRKRACSCRRPIMRVHTHRKVASPVAA